MPRLNTPAGYNATSFHARSSSCGVISTLPSRVVGGERYSNDTCTLFARCGTVTWKARTSTVSRTQSRTCSPLRTTRPDSAEMGPVGPWSPGTHCGYSSTRSPAACTGMVSCTLITWRAKSVASTASSIVPGQAVSLGDGIAGG